MSKEFTAFKKDFKSWCGFELESTEKDDIVKEIGTRQWQMECDINAQAKGLKREIDKILPDED